jgi:hypothetical protein
MCISSHFRVLSSRFVFMFGSAIGFGVPDYHDPNNEPELGSLN